MPPETSSLRPVLDLADSLPGRPLLVLDIDETLLRPPTELGSEDWFHSLIEGYQAQGLAEVEATLRANADWEKAHETIQPEAVEAEAPYWVDAWQKVRPVLGLTSRHGRFAGRTRAQLHGAGFTLRDWGPLPPRDFGPHGHWDGAIFYVGPMGDKGLSFGAFLDLFGLRPDSVVFVDDRPGHLKSMREQMEKRGIPCAVTRFVPKPYL